MRSLLVVVLVIAANAPAPGAWMDGPALAQAFGGETLAGFYGDGRWFRESYFASGRLDYTDAAHHEDGNWSVAGNVFCTFYRGMTGGCFRVERAGENCFRFYFAANAGEGAPPGEGASSFVGTGWRASRASTCAPGPSV
jgi:hypothetical protein